MVEGRRAEHVLAAGALAGVARAYEESYGWTPSVRDGALWADAVG